MELILSTISAGGLVGAADQYLCLVIVGVMSRLGVVTLTPQMRFMESWWFLAVVGLFWVLTVAPAYLSTLDPVVLKTVNTVTNFMSGFLVPASAALISLASIGIITSLHPDLMAFLETLRIFGREGEIGATGWMIAGGGGATAAALTGMRFLSKPAATATAGNLAAPANATAENTASIVLMSAAYGLAKSNPWLLVGLLALVIVLTVVLLVLAILQFRRLKKGIGQVLQLVQTNPRAGLAVVVEFLLWGVGWLLHGVWGRGALMLAALAAWWTLFLSLEGLVAAALVVAPPLIPVGMTVAAAAMLTLFVIVGLSSARALLHTQDAALAQTDPQLS